MRSDSSCRALFGVFLAAVLAACSSGGGNMVVTPDNDRDLSMGSDDGGVHEDLLGRDLWGADLSTPPNDLSVTTGLPCTAGSYRCGPANAVEICNSTGSAWLYSSTCAVACASGLCTGACTPGTRRCNAKNVEECNVMGTSWAKVESCSGSCSSGKCALVSLDITMNQNLDGEILVDGDVLVHSGVTVTSPKGDLTIRAKTITIENMATITAAPKGNAYGSGQGSSPNSTYYYYGGGGGGNGNGGAGTSGAGGGGVIGVDTDIDVQGGGNGGGGVSPYGGSGGIGGGVIRLIATDDITVAGFLTANGTDGGRYSSSSYGGGGGGAGGSILIAGGGKVNITGSVSAAGGAGGAGYNSSAFGGAGGAGRVKLFYGESRTVTGSINARRTDALLPPPFIASSSHPDPSLTYNDNFDTVEFAWTSPFASRQGYYHMVNQTYSQVPTPATAAFVMTESKSYPYSSVRAGANYFHIAPVDSMSVPGTAESRFLININTTPVSVSSSSHASSSTWYANPDVFFSWTLPLADRNQQGVYYVFDNYGDTMPTKASTFVPLPQKTLLRSSVTQGIWVLHMVAMDQRGYLTRTGQHFRVKVGTDPGDGVVLGQITDAMAMAIPNATVSLNRGLWAQTTNSSGNFNFATVSAGTYEMRVTATGKSPVTQMITVTKGMSTTANAVLP